MTKGRFITFEGGEGTGKSTQARLLASYLTQSGLDVVQTREPGGSPSAEDIRALLVTGAADRWSPIAETLAVLRRARRALAAGHRTGDRLWHGSTAAEIPAAPCKGRDRRLLRPDRARRRLRSRRPAHPRPQGRRRLCAEGHPRCGSPTRRSPTSSSSGPRTMPATSGASSWKRA